MSGGLTIQNQRFLDNLNRIQARIDKAQSQMTSGLRITVASDDPDAIGPLLQARSDLAAVTQTTANLGRAKGELGAAEGALNAVIGAVERARTAASQGQTGTQTAETRQILAGQVEDILNQLVGAANTTFDGRYLFSGNSDGAPAYALDLTQPDGVTAYAGASSSRSVPDTDGVAIPLALSGAEIFQFPTPGENVFGAVNALRAALAANDEAGIAAANTALGTSLEHLNRNLSWYGRAQNRVNTSLDIAQKKSVLLQSTISDTEEADLAGAILEFQTAQTFKQSALQAKTYEDRRTLFDFLK